VTKFLWPVRVYYEDTDSGGVVYYANYLKFMERARTEWLRSLGFEQDTLKNDQGIVFAVRSIKLDYLRPGHFNELLQVESAVLECGKASMTFEQNVTREGAHRELLCAGNIKVACIDAVALRPKPIPVHLLEEISRVG